jgi:hypothetical protein
LRNEFRRAYSERIWVHRTTGAGSKAAPDQINDVRHSGRTKREED